MKPRGIARTDAGHGNDVGERIPDEMEHPLHVVRIVHAPLVTLGGDVVVVGRSTRLVKAQNILDEFVRLTYVMRREGRHRERTGPAAVGRHHDGPVALVGALECSPGERSLWRFLKQG